LVICHRQSDEEEENKPYIEEIVKAVSEKDEADKEAYKEKLRIKRQKKKERMKRRRTQKKELLSSQGVRPPRGKHRAP
jgi:hypothetical protein